VHGRIFVVLAGQPCKHKYHTSVCAAYDIITAQGIATGFPVSMRKHCRSLFAAINVGLTYGKGCSTPSWLDNKQYDPIAQCLLADTHINRIANFASSVFLPAFFPTLADLIWNRGVRCLGTTPLQTLSPQRPKTTPEAP
jgi:hypothetical protein